MSNPPVIGQDPWGEDLNGYLAELETWVGSSPPPSPPIQKRWIDPDTAAEFWWTGEEWIELGTSSILPDPVALSDDFVADLVYDDDSNTQAALDERYAAASGQRFPVSYFGVKGDGSNDVAALQVAFDSGKPLIVPKGVKVTIGNTPLRLVSGLDLVIDGRIERNVDGVGSGGASAMFTGGSLDRGGVRLKNIHISGTGSVGAVSLTVGRGVVFSFGADDSIFEGFTVDTYWGGQAFIFAGDRLRFDKIRVINSGVTAGTGGMRFCGGNDFIATGCHIESGDDCLQFVPSETTNSPDSRRSAYIGCTGFSTAGRFMVVIAAGAWGGVIEDCSFIGCHGKATSRGLVCDVIESSSAKVRRISFRDCTIDATTDVGTAGGALYVTEESSHADAVIEDITFDNVTILAPNLSAIVAENVARLTINNCTFEKARNPTLQHLRFTNCKDLTFTNNMVRGLGTVSTFMLEGGSDRALIENNWFWDLGAAYGMEIKSGADIRIRRNHFRNDPAVPLVNCAIRTFTNGAFTNLWIYDNDFSELVATNALSISNASHVHIFDNKGIPAFPVFSGTILGPVYEHMRQNIQLTNISTVRVDVPPDSTRNFPIGEWFEISTYSLAAPDGIAHVCTVAPDTGATLAPPPANIMPLQVNETYRIIKTAPNTWAIQGRAKPVGNWYAEYPEYPATSRLPGTMWIVPSVGHSAFWTGTTWKPITPVSAQENICCILGNAPYYIDTQMWAGSANFGNLGLLSTTVGTTGGSTIPKGTDAGGRWYGTHSGSAGHIDLPPHALFQPVAAQSFSFVIVKASTSYVASTAFISSRATSAGAANPGWGLYAAPNTTGAHIARISDGTNLVEATTAVIPLNQIKPIIVVRNVGTDTFTVDTDTTVSAGDTTTGTLVSVDAAGRIGRLAGAGAGRPAMSFYAAMFTDRALTATEITTLKTWAAARYV